MNKEHISPHQSCRIIYIVGHALLPLLLLCALFIIFLAPSGERSFTWTPKSASRLIGRPLPDARTTACTSEQGACTMLVDEPLYMSLTPPPGTWNAVRVTMTYQKPEAQPFALGMMHDPVAHMFTLYPVEEGERNEQGQRVGSVTLPLAGSNTENGAYKIIFSLPGVKNQEEKMMLFDVTATWLQK